MSKITGRAVIRVDGQVLSTERGATLNIGGVNREAKIGNQGMEGYTEEDVAPELDANVYHKKDTSMKWLGSIAGATVVFETDTGPQYILRDAFVTEAPALDTGNGTVALKMSAMFVDEV